MIWLAITSSIICSDNPSPSIEDVYEDCCQDDSECLFLPYAVGVATISTCKGTVNCVAGGVFAVGNVVYGLLRPKTTLFHPLITVHSVIQPLAKIPCKPFVQVGRMIKNIYLVDSTRCAKHEIAKIQGDWLERNYQAEKYFKENKSENNLFMYRINKANHDAWRQNYPVRSQKSKNLPDYYQLIYSAFELSKTITSEVTSTNIADTQDEIQRVLALQASNMSWAMKLFRRSKVKEMLKITALAQLQWLTEERKNSAKPKALSMYSTSKKTFSMSSTDTEA